MKTKTATKPKKKTTRVMAEEMMANYLKAKKKKKALDDTMKESLAYLKEYADENRDKFDEKDNLEMKGGYLHFGKTTVVVECDTFDLGKFMEDFPELVNHSMKTAAIKAMLESEAGQEKLTHNHCVTLDTKETFSVVTN